MTKSTVAVKFTGDTKDLKRATAEAERGLSGFGKKVGPVLTKAMAGAGLAAGGALVDGFFEKMDRDKVQARLVGSLGLDDAEAERLGSVAGEVYSDGFGESFEQVNEAVAQVMTRLEDFADPDDLEPISKKALDLAFIFEQEVGEQIEAVRYLLVNELAPDAENAFDVITTALQRVAPEMRGEVLDAIGEYSQNFSNLGFTAQEALELIVNAGQNTSVGIDKVGDTMKEFTDLATEETERTISALEGLGLPAQELVDTLLQGGEDANEAFRTIIEALLAIEDPSEQAAVAVGLFGEPMNDLSKERIPELLEAMLGLEEGFGDVQGASADATEALDGDARKFQENMRKLEDAQQEFVNRFMLGIEMWGDLLSDTLDTVAGKFAEAINLANQLSSAIDRIPGVGDIIQGAAGSVLEGLPIKKSKLTLKIPTPLDGGGFLPGTKIPEFALGGMVPGPKGKATPAIVHGGERVLTTAEVDAMGGGGSSVLLAEVRGLRADLRERDGVSIINYYPKPETVSDALERSLRKAAVAMGGT